MAYKIPAKAAESRTILIEESLQKDSGNSTALYTYLNKTLKSPRLRRMLEEGAQEHEAEVEVARRT